MKRIIVSAASINRRARLFLQAGLNMVTLFSGRSVANALKSHWSALLLIEQRQIGRSNHHLNTTMSYGVWKKHKKSKGWSSIEIDSPWNGHTVRDLADAAEHSERAKTQFSFLKSAVHKHLPYDCWYPADAVHEYWDENLDQFRWRIQQAKTYPHRKIESYYIGGGEHQTWIAFDDVHALIDGLKANGAGSDLIQKEIQRLFEEYLKTQHPEDQSVTN